MINFTRMRETFQEAKAKERLVPANIIKEALEKVFWHNICLEKANMEDEMKGIDFFVRAGGTSFSFDLKVRDNTKRPNAELVVEKEWINCNKKAWLDNSKADYFLFAHVFDDSIVFYLVESEALRRFCSIIRPKREVQHSDKNGTTAVLVVYDYADLFAFTDKWFEAKVSKVQLDDCFDTSLQKTNS